jgi:hypothetical protein
MRVKFGNSTKDVPILEVTAENYIVPRGEEDTYHCRIEQMQFNPRNGKRQSRPRIQKFDAKMFPMLRRNLAQQGWDIEVLYDPTWYNAAKEAKRQEMQEMTFKQRQEAEAKRKAAEREQMKKEILAELKEMGMLKAKEQKASKEPKTGGSK